MPSAVRLRCGTVVSVVCILLNILLSGFKLLFGTLVGSIAITADGVNNLSDAASSFVSLVSFRVAAKPADREHPFGHARIEYVASMIVSFLILLVGADLFRSSVEKIMTPAESDDRYFLPSVIVLAVSILVKCGMAILGHRIGRQMDSPVMRATTADSLSDCISTFAVLLSTLLNARFGWGFLDAYFGMFVSFFIFYEGIKILRETKDSIRGEKPVEATVDAIRRVVAEYPGVLGVHDLLVHSYGPGHTLASFHAEVDGSRSMYDVHEELDTIERRLHKELCILCTIHADPVPVGDAELDALQESVRRVVAGVDARFCLHDFHLMHTDAGCRMAFDVSVPYECPMSDEAIRGAIHEGVQHLQKKCRTMINIDRI